jgi:hypothetical protein
MFQAPVLPFLIRGGQHRAAPRRRRPDALTAWGSENVESVEVVTPDGYASALLIEYVGSWYPAQILTGKSWSVRLEGGPAGGEWVFEVFALVERWLEAVPLPCAKVRYGGSTYLIRASPGSQPFAEEPNVTPAPAA